MLDGFEIAARAWERVVCPLRLDRYEAGMLDTLCLTGEVAWAKWGAVQAPGSGPQASDVTRMPGFVAATPVMLFLREHADVWRALRADGAMPGSDTEAGFSQSSRDVLHTLQRRGASFLRELSAACDLDEAATAAALGDLAARGLVSSDGFGGVRALVRASSRRPLGRQSHAAAGRWSLIAPVDSSVERERAVETQARILLKRYGVVFRKVVARENVAVWRDLARVYRRLEARGEIRGGRFVAGVSGEQFALPEAVQLLREMRRTPARGVPIVISAVDPLNLTGIVTAGERVRAVTSTRILYRDGVPIAVLESREVRALAEAGETLTDAELAALSGRRTSFASQTMASGYRLHASGA